MQQTKCICDRCGNEIPIRPHLYLKYKNKKRRSFRLKMANWPELDTEKELCKNCRKSFMKWLDGKERENNGN